MLVVARKGDAPHVSALGSPIAQMVRQGRCQHRFRAGTGGPFVTARPVWIKVLKKKCNTSPSLTV